MGESGKEGNTFQSSVFQINGKKVTIRPILPSDSEIEWSFVHHLSSQSKYLRFMTGTSDLTAPMVRYFTNIDFTKDMALIAAVYENGQEQEIAVGRYFKSPGKPVCEFALVVADEWQNMGIGTIIMELLILDAKNKGYQTMEGEILSTNINMLHFVKHLGFKTSIDKDDAKVTKAVLNLKNDGS